MHGLNWKSYQRRPDCNFLLLFRKEGFSLLIVVFEKKSKDFCVHHAQLMSQEVYCGLNMD